MVDETKFMKVTCVSVNNKIFSLIKIGNTYYLERDSMYIDRDGKVQCIVYDESMKKIGKFPHVHFISLHQPS